MLRSLFGELKNIKKINIKGRKMLMKLINDIILWSIWLGAMFLAFIVFIAKNEYLWAGVAIVPIMIAYADIMKTKKLIKERMKK